MKNKILTLLLLFNKEKQEVLLGFKKRGFGAGKWNGFGGKVSESESIIGATQRELKEESGVVAKNPFFLGLISFEFKGDPEIFQVHLFKAFDFEGIVEESEEMKPHWFKISEVPFKSMWIDDEIWFPYVLNDLFFVGYFLFEGHEKILNYKIDLVSKEELEKIQNEKIKHKLY